MTILIVGNNGSSYTITDASRIITVKGADSFTLENLLYVFNITKNKLYYSPAEDVGLAAVSGGDTITIDSSFDVMDDDDKIHIQLSTGDIAFDSGLKSKGEVPFKSAFPISESKGIE